MASVLTQTGTATELLELTNSSFTSNSEGANAEDDEARGIDGGNARGGCSRRTRETENSGQSFVIAK